MAPKNNYDHDSEELEVDHQRKRFQLIVNTINSGICVSKDIINLVEDIKLLTAFFLDIKIDYCNRLTCTKVDAMAKIAL